MTLSLPALELESPSLALSQDGAPAYELKFLLDEGPAQEVEAWARTRLALDAHGEAALGGAYRTTTLYCDTPQGDVYQRAPGHKRHKYRVRLYGSSPVAYLERKSKKGDRVAKLRSAIPVQELPLLGHPMSLVDWPAHWFHFRLLDRDLGPACRVSYERTAYVGLCAEGGLRLTLDRRVRGLPADDWALAPLEGGLPLLTGQVILELKFRSALPALFKELVQEMRLAPAAVSKYRRCREAWGPTGAIREAIKA